MLEIQEEILRKVQPRIKEIMGDFGEQNPQKVTDLMNIVMAAINEAGRAGYWEGVHKYD